MELQVLSVIQPQLTECEMSLMWHFQKLESWLTIWNHQHDLQNCGSWKSHSGRKACTLWLNPAQPRLPEMAVREGGGGSCLNMWVKGKTSIPSGWNLHCGKKRGNAQHKPHSDSQCLLIAFTEKATEFVCAGARAKNGWLHGHFVPSLLHSATISSPHMCHTIPLGLSGDLNRRVRI